MKIEICEQMVQSWLINCQNCQVAQTNWFISPLKDIDSHKKDISDYIDYFVNALNKGVSSGKLDSDVWNPTEEDASELHKLLCEDGEEVSFMEFFHMMVTESEAAKDQKGNVDFSKISILGRAGKAKELQFVKQTEIDILGIELDNGQAKNIYIIDTAFHKAGLNYSDTVSSVTKKIIRAVLVADIIFGTNIPVHIVFASPVCKSGPEGKIQAVKKYIEPLIEKRPTLHGATSLVKVEVYLNQAFAEQIYLPLRREIDKLNNDNDLFMRAMNLAKAAENRLTTPTSAPSTTKKKAAKTPASSTTTARKTATDDFADFKTFVGKSSASGYCTSIRKIMREMGLNTLADLEASLPAAINHCTTKMGSATNKKESKLYSDYRAALRRYEKFLLSVKACP